MNPSRPRPVRSLSRPPFSCTGMRAHPAVLFPESDVQHPVYGILDRPMGADLRSEDGRIIAAARQEIADLALDFVGAVEAADALDGKHGAQPRPAAEGFEMHCIGAGEHPASHQAASAPRP